jgi:hypothetical protein
MQLIPVSFAEITFPPSPKKVISVGFCERVLGVNEKKLVGGVCNPYYKKPEATAARKKATAEKKAARGSCSTPGCDGINNRGRDNCYTCSNPYKSK